MRNLLDAVRDEFFTRLSTNTTWGRNMVKELYTQVERDILSANITNEQLTEQKVNVYDKPAQINSNAVWDYKSTIPDISQHIGYHIPDDEENPFKDDKGINKGF